jgi:hypothetical protein
MTQIELNFHNAYSQASNNLAIHCYTDIIDIYDNTNKHVHLSYKNRGVCRRALGLEHNDLNLLNSAFQDLQYANALCPDFKLEDTIAILQNEIITLKNKC